ncbi:MAG: hypothetical protein MJ252_20330, partial [archaeon]|nr:hypothetical protein [archaeon]
KVSPKKESPKKESPRKISPRKESPKKESPKKESPKKDSPKKETETSNLDTSNKYNDFVESSLSEKKKPSQFSNIKMSDDYGNKNYDIDEDIKSQTSEKKERKIEESKGSSSGIQNKIQPQITSEGDDYGGFDEVTSTNNFDNVLSSNAVGTSNVNPNKKQSLIESSGNFSERYKNLIGTESSNLGESSGKYEIKNEKKTEKKEPPKEIPKEIKEDYNDDLSISSGKSKSKLKESSNLDNLTPSKKESPSKIINRNENEIPKISSGSNEIQNLIKNAVDNYMRSSEFEKIMNSKSNGNFMSSSVNQFMQKQNNPNINEANSEFSKFYEGEKLMRDGDIKLIKFEPRKLIPVTGKKLTFEPAFAMAQKEVLQSLKLEAALAEEENKRILSENKCNSLRDTNLKLEEEIRKLNDLRFENGELKKSLQESQVIINEMKSSVEGMKEEYEGKLKMIEDRINNRESQIYETKKNDIEKRFQLDLLKKNYELEAANKQIDFLKNKNKVIEEENTKLKANDDNSEKFKNLEKENFVLQEKFNTVSKERDKLEVELHRAKMQGANYGVKIDESGTNINMDSKGGLPNELVNYNTNSQNLSKNGKKVKISNESSNYFDKVMYEKEFAAQEKLLNAYVKEIENLNKEIAFLKSIPGCHSKPNKPTEKQIKINSSLKQSAEEKIKQLQNFLYQKSGKPSSSDKTNMEIMEKNFLSVQQNSGNKDTGNEISFDNFMIVMRDLETPLSSNDLIEVFNNFERINGNRIRLSDFMNAVNSTSPSTFFIQNDPPFLNALEQKLTKAQNRVKELEKFIITNHGENEILRKKLSELQDENTQLKQKVNDTNIQMLNYFLKKGDNEARDLLGNNSEYKVISEKFKSIEKDKQYEKEQLNQKLGNFDKKMNEIKKDFEEKKNSLEQECAAQKQKVADLENQKVIMQRDFDSKEASMKDEIHKLNDKLEKYKKNFCNMKNQKEEIINEKERILNCLNEKGISAEKILTFCDCSDDVKLLLGKIDVLQKKNEDREERYKKLCVESNRDK